MERDWRRKAERERAAAAWWADIDERDRGLAREVIGEYVDLPGGRRRLRDEAGYILQAFEMVVPPEGHDPADCYLPAAVFGILDAEMAATGIAGTTLVAAWRQCAPDRYGFIADPLASIALFAEEARRGRPAALEAVNKAKAAMKKAPKAA